MIKKTLDKITLNEIKQILIKHNSKIDRELIVWEPQKDKGGDCYFFALNGTPPKGYGIYICETHSLCLYDENGKIFKNYNIQEKIKFD